MIADAVLLTAVRQRRGEPAARGSVPATAPPSIGVALDWIFAGSVIAVTGSARLSLWDKQVVEETRGWPKLTDSSSLYRSSEGYAECSILTR